MKKELKYESLARDLITLKEYFLEVKENFYASKCELESHLNELLKKINSEDIEKFNDVTGVTARKNAIDNLEKSIANKEDSSKINHKNINKKNEKERWVKQLYRTAVRRCHPDKLDSISDDDYRDELINIYKDIVEAYDSDEKSDLMISCFKLLVKPKKITTVQLDLLADKKKLLSSEINKITKSDQYMWFFSSEEQKELILINFLKQMGIRFVDKEKVREVIRRKPAARKPGQRPVNRLKLRVNKE